MKRTTVDLDQLKGTLRWLQATRNEIEAAVEILTRAPTVLGNAPVNGADPNRPGAGKELKQLDRNVPAGMVTEVGPTFLGIFDTATKVAAKHAGDSNGAVQELRAILADLDKALQVTSYMVENFAKVENLNAAGVNALFAAPPYLPGPASDRPAEHQGRGW